MANDPCDQRFVNAGLLAERPSRELRRGRN